MCIAPMTISDGTQVACRNCWQCRAARIDDWVGRCIAESRTVAGASAITLTYGRDNSLDSVTYGEAEHERAAVLTYSDVQKYFKRLRRKRIREKGKPAYGYPCRYFVTGEYGSAKGRAHWHVIVFWLEKVPPHQVGTRFLEEHWPHGVSFWTAPSYEDFRYNCKYILKGMGEAERQGHLSMSKKPLIGADYFRQRAADLAKQGLPLKDLNYTFPEAVRKNGERVQFRLSGAAKALYIDAYLQAWRELNGAKPWPASDVVTEYVDKGAFVPLDRHTLKLRKQERQRRLRAPADGRPDHNFSDEFLKSLGMTDGDIERYYRNDYHLLIAKVAADVGRQLTEQEYVPLWHGKSVKFSDTLNTYVYQLDGRTWMWRLNAQGVPEWQEVVKAERTNFVPRARAVPARWRPSSPPPA
nr:MAG: replication initiator protein [Microvirus sp.]